MSSISSKTTILAFSNSYKDNAWLINESGSGTNVDNLADGGVALTGEMTVPVWDGKKTTWAKNHIAITAGKVALYIWQDSNDSSDGSVRFSSKEPATQWDGQLLLKPIGGDILVSLTASGSLNGHAIDKAAIKAKAKSITKENHELIQQVKSNSKTFAKSSSGKSIIAGITQNEKSYTDSDTNYVQETINNTAFSGMNLGTNKGLNKKIGETITVGVGMEGSVVLGLSGDSGLAWNPANKDPELAGYKSLAVTLGAQVGISASFLMGFWTSTPDNLGGVTLGYVTSTEFFGLGASIATFLNPSDLSLSGMVIGIGVGVDFAAAVFVSATSTRTLKLPEKESESSTMAV